MRINILLIICLLSGLNSVLIHGNSVSGIYNAPVNSVKFEKQSEFSLLPVGWSKKGNAAFVIINRTNSHFQLKIIDTVVDEMLYESETFSLQNQSLGASWIENVDLISENLSRWEIIPDENPQYGGLKFSFEGDDYSIYTDQTSMTGKTGIAALQLRIESKKLGSKSLLNYVHDDASGLSLYDYNVLGYFKSPWENRIAVLSSADYVSDDKGETVQLFFSGAHLSIGYTRAVSSETELIDAVLTGQYYTARIWLDKGADPDALVPTGEALILMAAKQNNWDIVFLLMSYNAQIALIDSEKRTLLHYAVLSGNLEVVRKLILKGLNKNFKDINGKTAFDLAQEKGFEALSQILRE